MSLSEAARAQALALESDEVVAVLLRISHEDLADDIRLVNAALAVLSADPHHVGVVSGGLTYYYLPFEFQPPEEGESAGGRASITVPNIRLPGGSVTDMQAALRLIGTAVTIEAEIIVTTDVDAPEASFPAMAARVAQVDASAIRLELIAETLANEPLTSMNYDPARFGGLYD